MIPLISYAKSSWDAWNRLSRLYAKRSNQHAIHLKDKLSMISRGSSFVIDFLVSIKQIADELTSLGAPYSTRGLGNAYKVLITVLRTRDSVVPFEGLFDKIINHETHLLHHEQHNLESSPTTAHLAKHLHSSPRYLKVNSPFYTPGLLSLPYSVTKQTKLPVSLQP